MAIYQRMMGAPSVRIDTRLDEASGVRVGENLRGSVVLSSEQGIRRVKRIEFQLIAVYAREEDKKIVNETDVIYRYVLETDVVISRGEKQIVPFQFPIPLSTPITIESSKVWLETEAVMDMEAVRNDRDVVPIKPHPITAAFFEAVGLLGLRLDEVSLLHVPELRPEFPFVQEFEFKPRLPSFLDEIEVYYDVKSQRQVDFYVEIDRRVKGLLGMLEEAFDLDERCIKVTLTDKDISSPEQLADHLAQLIKPHLQT